MRCTSTSALRSCLPSVLMLALASAACGSDEAADAAPASEDNFTSVVQVPGYTTASYLAPFSPGLLKSARAQTVRKGQNAPLIGAGSRGGCYAQRLDTWKTSDLVVQADEQYYFEGRSFQFIRFSDGKLGVRTQLRAYPKDDRYVPLYLYCWNNRGDMPTADDIVDALTTGWFEFRFTFTPSNAVAKDAGVDAH